MDFKFDFDEYSGFISRCSDDKLVSEKKALQAVFGCDEVVDLFILDILNEVEELLNEEIFKRYESGIRKEDKSEIQVLGCVFRHREEGASGAGVVNCR